MSVIKTRCPACQRKLVLPKSTGHVRCPQCDHRFVINAPPVLMSAPAAAPPGAVMPSNAHLGHRTASNTATDTAPLEPAASAPLSATFTDSTTVKITDAPSPAPAEPATAPSSAHGPLIALGVGALLFLAAGIWLLMICLRTDPPPAGGEDEPFVELPFGPANAKASPVSLNAPSSNAPLTALASAKIGKKPPAPPVKKGKAPAGKVKPVAANKGGIDQVKIDQAIERGAAYLHKTARDEKRVGVKAFAGLTLLHCGAPNADPVVAELASDVRKQAANHIATYELSLCILFLDRLGDPADRPLIRTIALRLMASQGPMGGWNYQCQQLDATRQQQLLDLLASLDRAGPKAPSRTTAPPLRGAGSPLPTDLSELPVAQYQPGTPLTFKPHAHEDNSLTQFAVLALWTAQRHGVPVERSLAMVDARFRASQAVDGSWSYEWTSPQNTLRPDSMTCAGLIGLAVGRGNVKDANLKKGDPAIEKGLRFVSQRIGSPKSGYLVGAASIGDLYYLWTLERAAVIFDLQTIGGKDWYAWGAPLIVTAQNPSGFWHERHGPVPDTCFALLFLKRANVAHDLTVRLQDLAISKHIGERARDIDRQPDDPFGRRSDLTASQRAAAGYSRGREEAR